MAGSAWVLVVTLSIDLVTARARAESLMTSTCTIRGASSGQETDEDSGEVTDTPGAVVYSGPCRIRPMTSRGAGTTDAGGSELFAYDFVLDLPFSATGIKARQRVTIDTSPDPDTVGLAIEVQRPYPGDQVIRRKILCTEVA